MIYLQGMREVKRLIHPNGGFHYQVRPVTLCQIDWLMLCGVFFSVYVFFFLLSVCALMAVGNLDFITAFSAVGACLNNLGPGLGEVAINYVDISADVKWILMFNMVLGRLEIFTLLVLLTPAYWRR
jgi:trk system potassium uptake protein TrkH